MMSGVGIKTKKVNTYGRKKTNIITVRPDFTPEPKRARTPLPDSSDEDNISPIKPRRPVLSTKLSQDISSRLNIPPPPADAGTKGKGKAKSVTAKVRTSTSSEEVVKAPRVRSRRVVPSTPAETPARMRQTIECVEIPSRVITTGKKSVADVVDLTQELEDLIIAATPSKPSREASPVSSLSLVTADNLLNACSSPIIQSFTDFLSSPTLLGLLPSRAQPVFAKIGEASYSEVFSIKRGKHDLILKVVPLLPACAAVSRTSPGAEVPDCSSPEEVLKEVEITQTMAQLKEGGFVDFKGAFVVKGEYPTILLEEFDEYQALNGSASISPATFSSDQLYALIVLSNGGPDLETFKFDKANGWVQAAGVFWQIVGALARAENQSSFEHRDLHEGQILISACPVENNSTDYSSPLSTGIQTTIIDFGLSRLNAADGRVIHTEIHSEIFEGVGDQWDVYRSMRDIAKSDWNAYHPVTNVMWLHYILRHLLQSKKLVKPRLPKIETRVPGSPIRTRRVPLTRKAPVKTAIDTRTIHACEILQTMESLLKDSFANGRDAQQFRSARDVWTHGQAKGWVV